MRIKYDARLYTEDGMEYDKDVLSFVMVIKEYVEEYGSEKLLISKYIESKPINLQDMEGMYVLTQNSNGTTDKYPVRIENGMLLGNI